MLATKAQAGGNVFPYSQYSHLTLHRLSADFLTTLLSQSNPLLVVIWYLCCPCSLIVLLGLLGLFGLFGPPFILPVAKSPNLERQDRYTTQVTIGDPIVRLFLPSPAGDPYPSVLRPVSNLERRNSSTESKTTSRQTGANSVGLTKLNL